MALYVPWASADLLASAKLNAQVPTGASEMFIPANAVVPWHAKPCGEHQQVYGPIYGGFWVGMRFDPNDYFYAIGSVWIPKAVHPTAEVKAEVYWTCLTHGPGTVCWFLWMGSAGHGEYPGGWWNTHANSIWSSSSGAAALSRSPRGAGAGANNPGPHKLTQLIIGRYGHLIEDTFPYDAYLLGVKLTFATTEVNDA